MEGLTVNTFEFVEKGGLTVLFFVLIGLIIGLGVMNFLLCLFNVKNFCKKKWWFITLVFGVSCIYTAIGFFGLKGVQCISVLPYSLSVLGVGIICFVPSLFCSGNSYTVKLKTAEDTLRLPPEKPQIDPVDFFKNNSVAERVLRAVNSQTSVQKIPPVREIETPPPLCNFSHLKSVLERMDFYNLSAQDRKQVENLKLLIVKAETEPPTETLQDELNDGLNILLKIMSKYKV